MSSAQRTEADPGSESGTFSIVTPVFRPRPSYLTEMIDSVQKQTDSDWELILVDDGSGSQQVSAILAAAEAADSRIKVLVLEANSGIVAATDHGIVLARGGFVCLLDHDDTLAPDALAVLRAALLANPDADVLYTDEDQIHGHGQYSAEFRKPDFSPERLRGQMYLGHLVAYRRALLDAIGGMRAGYDGSQDYDLALRATEQARRVVHIPQVAYHWRIHDESVSHRSNNDAVFDAAKRALTDHLRRVHIGGTVEQVHPVGVYRIRRELADTPLVSIIIPTRGSRRWVRGRQRVMVTDAVHSIVDVSSYTNYEIVLVADTATPAGVITDVRSIVGDRLRVVEFDQPFNFSAKINIGAIAAGGDQLLLLNDDVEVISRDWIETMLALSTDDVGLVGAKLLYEDGTIQHIGHVYDGGEVMHLAAGAPGDWPGPMADLLVEREVSGVTAACAMIRRDIFESVGGMSLALPINFNDVDLSLKVRQSGYRILVTPFAVLHHFESQSRVRAVAPSEVRTLRARWDHLLQSDPYWRHDPAQVSAAIERARGATT